MAFNAIVAVSELIRLTPSSLSNVGLVLLIAMTYVPETRNQLQRIREAQELRGHQIHGLRDWRPIVIPLLIGGMERAINLSETMVSRGYGATSSKRQPLRTQFGLLGGLLLVFGGSILVFWFSVVGWIIIITGILIILGIFIWNGRQIQVTRYRPQTWTTRDWLLSALSFIPLTLIWVPLEIVDSTTIFYTPYPILNLPAFDVVLGLGLAVLAAPAILNELGV